MFEGFQRCARASQYRKDLPLREEQRHERQTKALERIADAIEKGAKVPKEVLDVLTSKK